MDVLQRLEPVSERYATLPVADAFTWGEAGSDLGDGEWYLVAFRSIRRADADEERLTKHDDLAHAEAASAPGFVHYFKGPAGADGSCLSFCLWQTRADARVAAGGPLHVQAVSLIDEMYESYTLEFVRVTRTVGGPLAFEPYDRPGVPPHVHVAGAELHPVQTAAPTLSINPAPAF
jgi:hypothetical protein